MNYLLKGKKMPHLFRGKHRGKWIERDRIYIGENLYIWCKGNIFPRKVDPDTLCISTDQTSSEGDLIWENDFIEYETPRGICYRGKVTYLNFGFCIIDDKKWVHRLSHRKGVSGSASIWSSNYSAYTTRKLGNVFDNPELLNKE